MKTKNLIISLLSAGILASATAVTAKTPPPKPVASLTVEAAQTAAMTALQQCRTQGYAVSVAVVDRHGNLVVQLRDPQAGPHTVNSAFGKAFTAASMGQPTANVAELIATNPALAGLRDMDSRMVILGGGLPMAIDGNRVGGIGVGGAPGGHLDAACAQSGLDSVGARL